MDGREMRMEEKYVIKVIEVNTVKCKIEKEEKMKQKWEKLRGVIVGRGGGRKSRLGLCRQF